MYSPFRIPVDVIFFTLFASLLSLLPACSKDDIRSPAKRIRSLDHWVILEGRWKQIASPATKLARINTTYVVCDKLFMICEENTAVLATPQDNPPGNSLYILNLKYNITQWSDDIIKASYAAPVADFELKISLRDNFAERNFRETKARGSETSDPNIFGHWELE